MNASGFEVGKYNVRTLWHQTNQMVTMVHGDDFVTTGDRNSCKWFKDKLSARFQIKTTVIGRGPGEVEEESVSVSHCWLRPPIAHLCLDL